ncbi:Uncharacterised protein [Chlamydia abortus]|nr:Uncharacterised protein [Chlamydia abortus]
MNGIFFLTKEVKVFLTSSFVISSETYEPASKMLLIFSPNLVLFLISVLNISPVDN